MKIGRQKVRVVEIGFLGGGVVAIVYLQKARIIASLENMAYSQSFSCMQNYYHLLKENVLSALIRKSIHNLFNKIFGK